MIDQLAQFSWGSPCQITLEAPYNPELALVRALCLNYEQKIYVSMKISTTWPLTLLSHSFRVGSVTYSTWFYEVTISSIPIVGGISCLYLIYFDKWFIQAPPGTNVKFSNKHEGTKIALKARLQKRNRKAQESLFFRINSLYFSRTVLLRHEWVCSWCL